MIREAYLETARQIRDNGGIPGLVASSLRWRVRRSESASALPGNPLLRTDGVGRESDLPDRRSVVAARLYAFDCAEVRLADCGPVLRHPGDERRILSILNPGRVRSLADRCVWRRMVRSPQSGLDRGRDRRARRFEAGTACVDRSVAGVGVPDEGGRDCLSRLPTLCGSF